jgi:O-antigen/teichoic acid export membrane protein
VRRPLARRRGGAALPTAGFLSIGVSATLLVVIGSRVLSAPAFSGLFVAWTIVNIFGFGIGTPTEQLISRRMNAAAPGSLRPALSRLLLAALISAAVTIGLAVGSAQAHDYPLLAPTALIAIGGWTAVVVIRGRLAGSGDLLGYAGVLGAESVIRTILLSASLLMPGEAKILMAAAVAVPVLVAAALGALFVIPQAVPGLARVPGSAVSNGSTPNGSAPNRGDGGAREQLWFVMYSVGYQVCLQAAVLLLGWRAGAARPAVVGAFGAANSYFRTPTVLMGGITTHALVMLSRAWGAADPAGMRAELRGALRNGIMVGLGGTLLLCAVAPAVLPIYYHHKLGLPLSLMAGLAVSTVLTVLAAILVQPLLAAARGGTAGLAWLTGGVTTVIMFALSSGTDRLATAALICGPLVAVLIAIAGVRRLGQADQPGSVPRAAHVPGVRITDSPVE